MNRSVAGHDSPLITNVKRGLRLTNTSVGIVSRDDVTELRGRQVRPFGDHDDPVRFDAAPLPGRRQTPRPARGTARARRSSTPSSGRSRQARSRIAPRVSARAAPRAAAQAVPSRAHRPVDDQRGVEIVADRHHDRRAFHHTDQRRGHGQRSSRLLRRPRSRAPDLPLLRAASARRRRASASVSVSRDRACPPRADCRWARRSGAMKMRTMPRPSGASLRRRSARRRSRAPPGAFEQHSSTDSRFVQDHGGATGPLEADQRPRKMTIVDTAGACVVREG